MTHSTATLDKGFGFQPRLWLSVVAEEVASVAGRGGDGSEGGGEMVVFGCGVAAAGNGCGGGGDEGGYGGCCGIAAV
ncbi:hypothetical protein Tco_1032708 [Tanacetum coccineum]|uniref:Uncharacterized protein n=1 Tax=Tanacetum coccineum TaxID=301880 RepID=A0ABQ5GEN6_9ASTR